MSKNSLIYATAEKGKIIIKFSHYHLGGFFCEMKTPKTPKKGIHWISNFALYSPMEFELSVILFWMNTTHFILLWRLSESSFLALAVRLQIEMICWWFSLITFNCCRWDAHKSGKMELSRKPEALCWFCTNAAANFCCSCTSRFASNNNNSREEKKKEIK